MCCLEMARGWYACVCVCVFDDTYGGGVNVLLGDGKRMVCMCVCMCV